MACAFTHPCITNISWLQLLVVLSQDNLYLFCYTQQCLTDVFPVSKWGDHLCIFRTSGNPPPLLFNGQRTLSISKTSTFYEGTITFYPDTIDNELSFSASLLFWLSWQLLARVPWNLGIILTGWMLMFLTIGIQCSLVQKNYKNKWEYCHASN